MEIKPLTIEQFDSIISLWEEAGLPFKPKGRDSQEEMEQEKNNTAEANQMEDIAQIHLFEHLKR